MAKAPIRIRVTAAAEKLLRRGHPWLYASSVRDQNRPGEMGDLGVVYDRKDQFLAIGLLDPESPLRLRVLHRGKPRPLDDEWWKKHFEEALAKRRTIPSETTTGLRLLHGENDDWPGLVLDRYADTYVIKLYTAAWLPRLAWLQELFLETLRPERLILRLSRNIQEWAERRFQIRDGIVLHGPAVAAPVQFLENGIRFEADVLRGQKTGFFLDQRENRSFVESLAERRDVWNAFSFSGGFSLYAARGGARSVTDLDISSHALQSAQRNMTLNQSDDRIRCCPHHTIQDDAFRWMGQKGPKDYDLIILDPPSLARRETEREGAIQAYQQLASQAADKLRTDGILVAASCSAHVSREEFLGAVRAGLASRQRTFAMMRMAGHPADHAPTFPEAHYLKCVYLRMLDRPN